MKVILLSLLILFSPGMAGCAGPERSAFSSHPVYQPVPMEREFTAIYSFPSAPGRLLEVQLGPAEQVMDTDGALRRAYSLVLQPFEGGQTILRGWAERLR